TAPNVSITLSPPSPGSGRFPTWSFTTEASATTECRLTGPSGVVNPWSSCSSPATYDLTGLADGDYTFDVRATDTAGNTGPVSSDTYTLDTTGPVVTITGAPTTPGNDPTPTWTFTTEAGATTECRLGYGSTILFESAPFNG